MKDALSNTHLKDQVFSLLIANYNNGKYFKDCYDSLIAQTYTNWKAIIVDDGSTDNSVEIIEAIIKDDVRFKLYKNKTNKGCAVTKHYCVQLAAGAICGYLDPDDALLPHAINKIIEAFTDHPDAVLIHSSLFFCDEDLNKESIYKKAGPFESANLLDFNLASRVTAFAGFKKAAYDKTEGIDPYMHRAVDQDLYLKLAETGAFYFVNEPLYLYRIHDRSISKNGNWKKARYWHWVAAVNAAKRRNLNLENDFIDEFSSRREADKLKKILNGHADGRFYLKMLLKKIKQKL